MFSVFVFVPAVTAHAQTRTKCLKVRPDKTPKTSTNHQCPEGGVTRVGRVMRPPRKNECFEEKKLYFLRSKNFHLPRQIKKIQ
jgi:hypothetical protein